jgi:hypothetical protein
MRGVASMPAAGTYRELRSIMNVVLNLSIAIAVAFSATTLRAGTNNFVVPEFRGTANSEAGYWESFTVAFGAPGNLADKAGATTGAVLTQNGSTASFITGSGNIYDFSEGIQAFQLTDATPFTLGTVVLQTRTLGSEVNYGSVTLTYTDAGGVHSLAPESHLELDRGTTLGASVSSLFQWDLTGLTVNEYSIAFNGADPSVSFDAMTLDTWNQYALVVPEPSTYALLGLGGVMLGWRTLRRRR